MAAVHTARIKSRVALSADATYLTLAMLTPEALRFQGGQYVIVDTGLVQANGRPAKRAYSIVSPDREPSHLSLVVRRLATGPGSNYLCDLPVGDVVRFSGPWGQMPLGAPWPSEADAPPLIIATDTGITAALGLLNSQKMADLDLGPQCLWLTTAEDYLGSLAFLREAMPPTMAARFSVLQLPPIGSAERGAAAIVALAPYLHGLQPNPLFLCGDGAVIAPIAAWAKSAGLPPERIRCEYFFHRPVASP